MTLAEVKCRHLPDSRTTRPRHTGCGNDTHPLLDKSPRFQAIVAIISPLSGSLQPPTSCGHAGVRMPGRRAISLGAAGQDVGRRTHQEICYRESGDVGYLEFSFPAGHELIIAAACRHA